MVRFHFEFCGHTREDRAFKHTFQHHYIHVLFFKQAKKLACTLWSTAIASFGKGSEKRLSFLKFNLILTPKTNFLKFFLASLSSRLRNWEILGADINACEKGGVGKSALMIAIKQDDVETFDLLLELGAKPALLTGPAQHSKMSALHYAAERSKLDFARKLLAAGCPADVSGVEAADPGLWTPLHSASLRASDEMIGLLLDHGANIDAKTKNGSTPLALAARHYKISTVRYLLSRKANVNTQDISGATPLLQACVVGATPVAKLLIEVGKADMTIKNTAGATALDEADRKDMWECALYVWSAGCESGALKTAKGLGPVKWTRPRILGQPSLTHLDSKTTSASSIASSKTRTEAGNVNKAILNQQNPSTGSILRAVPLSRPPTPRYGSTAVSLGSHLYVFGGRGYPEGVKTYNADKAFQNEDDDPEEGQLEEIVEPFSHFDFYRLNLESLRYRTLVPSDAKKSSINIQMSRSKLPPEVEVSEDGLSVKCVDDDLEDAEPVCVVAATPFVRSDGFSYFEVDVIHPGTRSITAVGIVEKDTYASDKMPGWARESIGYHADDACAFHNTGWGRQWGKRFGAGDVVGCGIIWDTGEVFYSLNGEFLGVAYRATTSAQYYAAVGFRNALAHVKMNFGAKPFVFDLRAPSLQWERLPTSEKEFGHHSPFEIFNLMDDSLVLLGSGRTTMDGNYWVWKNNKWTACVAGGERPFIFSQYSFTVIGDAIYVLIHHNSMGQLSQVYPNLPVLLRLHFSDDYKAARPDYDSDDEEIVGEDDGTDEENATEEKTEETENEETTKAGQEASKSTASASKAESMDVCDDSTPKAKAIPSMLKAKWQQIFPKPSSITIPQEHIDNWFHAHKIIASEFKNATIEGVDGKLCFVSKNSLALMDPETFEIEVKAFEGAVPPVDKFSTVVVGSHIETFGGWDQHSQRNEVNILDTRTARWYPPHVLGISPRPRNHHFAASVTVKDPSLLRSAAARSLDKENETASTSASSLSASSAPVASNPEENHSKTLIVHAYGWNGCNYIDDVEILSLQNKEPANRLISLLQPCERQGQAGVVNFKFTDSDGSVKWFSTSTIVACARASGFKQEILSRESTNGSLTIEIPAGKYPLYSFVAFLKFLHDDRADFDVDKDGARIFVKLVEAYAPEHSKRVVEALVLTRLNIRSRMSTDMEWAFNQDVFSDVTFQAVSAATGETHTIKAHKCILIARSSYFQSLFTGGLAESQLDTIKIEDADYEPFRLVIHYLYTESLDLEAASEYITDVFMLACKYAIENLKSQVESILAYNLSIENAASLFILADSHQSESLKKTCAKFIANNFEQVSLTPEYLESSQSIFEYIQPHLAKVELRRAQ